jgi:hypothetical protein
MKLTPEQVEALFPYFFAFWAAAALAAFAFFTISKNARLKRRAFVALTIGADVVLLGFIWATGAPLPFLALAGAFMAFGAWQAIRFTRFCDKCGANNFPQGQFQPRTECKKCSAPLVAG